VLAANAPLRTQVTSGSGTREPRWEQAAQLHWDGTAAPAPEYVFDQQVSW
jgi:hypothetical protein